jgi:hypothetical protein
MGVIHNEGARSRARKILRTLILFVNYILEITPDES